MIAKHVCLKEIALIKKIPFQLCEREEKTSKWKWECEKNLLQKNRLFGKLRNGQIYSWVQLTEQVGFI